MSDSQFRDQSGCDTLWTREEVLEANHGDHIATHQRNEHSRSGRDTAPVTTKSTDPADDYPLTVGES